MRKLLIFSIVSIITMFFLACGAERPPENNAHVVCYTDNLKIIDSDAYVSYSSDHLEFIVDGIRHKTTSGTACIAVYKK